MKLLFILLLSSCAVFQGEGEFDQVHTNHQPTARQRLAPRPGYEGKLTNQVCTAWEGDNCIARSLQEYDLNNEATRDMLNQFRFACSVAGKRYRICGDSPGLCRTERHTECLRWGKKLFTRKKVCREWGERIESFYIDANTEYQLLLNAATECRAGL